jgi:glycerophosphoryl diester phosphodiesterase
MPLIVAHRGASKAEKENTVEAFRAAKAMGADMVELDVRRTLDNVLIVHHDAHINDVAIITMRADELPSYVPTLEASLDACAGMDVNVEIKNDRDDPDYDAGQWVAGQVVALLAERGDHDRMLISSFDRATVNAVRVLDPTLRTGCLFVIPELVDGATLDSFVAGVAAEGHVAVHPHRRAATSELIMAAHAVGLAVNAWTIDNPDVLVLLRDIGVDALITNVPDIAREALSGE